MFPFYPMAPQFRFRLLLAASFLIALACVLVIVFPGNVSEEWRTVLEWHANGGFWDHLFEFDSSPSVAQVAGIAGLFLLTLVFLVAHVGLFFFWRWARTVYAVSCGLMLLSTPWGGLAVQLPWEETFFNLSMICEGAIIAFAYTSPISSFFESVKSLDDTESDPEDAR